MITKEKQPLMPNEYLEELHKKSYVNALYMRCQSVALALALDDCGYLFKPYSRVQIDADVMPHTINPQ